MWARKYHSILEVTSHLMTCIGVFLIFQVFTGFSQIVYTLISGKEISYLEENIYYGLGFSSIEASIITCLLIFMIIKYFYKEDIYTYLNINKPKGLLIKTLQYIGVFYLWIFGISIIVSYFKISGVDDGPKHIQELFSNDTNWPLLILAIGIIQPIFEEVLFRGLLFKGLEKKWGGIKTVAFTSIVFAGLHIQYGWKVFLLMTLPMGLILGIARLKTNSLLAPIIIHCTNNTLAITAQFFVISENI